MKDLRIDDGNWPLQKDPFWPVFSSLIYKATRLKSHTAHSTWVSSPLRARVPNPFNLMSDDLRQTWCYNNKNKVHDKCSELDSSPNYPPYPWSTEELSSRKIGPWCQKVWGPLLCRTPWLQIRNSTTPLEYKLHKRRKKLHTLEKETSSAVPLPR